MLQTISLGRACQQLFPIKENRNYMFIGFFSQINVPPCNVRRLWGGPFFFWNNIASVEGTHQICSPVYVGLEKRKSCKSHSERKLVNNVLGCLCLVCFNRLVIQALHAHFGNCSWPHISLIMKVSMSTVSVSKSLTMSAVVWSGPAAFHLFICLIKQLTSFVISSLVLIL